ncbi:MAG TPA: hydrogenase maturation protease [Gammaproteobacteria bacterium]|nr:hydrogenase maturation protease [Gammaproteobacteria bacterium]
MSTVAVLGIGSPFGGDRVGWEVVDLLGEAPEARAPGVLLRALDRPGPGLIAYLEGADHAVLVDAVRTGADPGTLRRFTGLAELPASFSLSTHGVGLGETLLLAGRLGHLPPWMVIGIEADTERHPGAGAVEAGVAAVRAELASLSRRG